MNAYNSLIIVWTYLAFYSKAATYDLYESNSAERFFSNSNIQVNFDLRDRSLTWTADTPLAVGCGASVLVFDDTIAEYEYHWQHIFSDTMDTSVPTINHSISTNIQNFTLVDIDNISTSINSLDAIDAIVNENSEYIKDPSKIAFRMFAFLPYGKGVFLSRTYALQLSNSTMYVLDFNDGYSGPLSKYMSPSFMLNQDFISNPLAFAQGPCYESIDMTANDSNLINVGAGNKFEGACVCEVDAEGFKKSRQLELKGRKTQSDLVCNEYSSPKVNFTFSDGLVAFHLQLKGGDEVAASFYYGVDPSPDAVDGAVNLSCDAFYDTDGFENLNGDINILHHGIVRAHTISAHPLAFGQLNALISDDASFADGKLLVGGVWIDSYFGVHYSRKTTIPLSAIFEQMTESSSSNVEETTVNIPESSICPTGTLKNIGALSQGASVLDVSSSYSQSYIASNAIDQNDSTQWSTMGDGNEAYITIQLPFPSNVVYVDFHSRTMVTSAQISKYQVEAGNNVDDLTVVASSCQVPDATKSYKCNLPLSNDNDPTSIGARNVTLIKFRVIDSSGGNTGAINLGVYGCSLIDEQLFTLENVENVDTGSVDEASKTSIGDTEHLLDVEKPNMSSSVVMTVRLISTCAYIICSVLV